jgi:hypothetical protein
MAAILVVLAFPRYSRQNTGRGELYLKFFCDTLTIKLSGGAPSRYEWYAVHFYPVWAIGGLKYYYDGSGHPTVFRQGPMWWLAIIQFIGISWLGYVLLQSLGPAGKSQPTIEKKREE